MKSKFPYSDLAINLFPHRFDHEGDKKDKRYYIGGTSYLYQSPPEKNTKITSSYDGKIKSLVFFYIEKGEILYNYTNVFKEILLKMETVENFIVFIPDSNEIEEKFKILRANLQKNIVLIKIEKEIGSWAQDYFVTIQKNDTTYLIEPYSINSRYSILEKVIPQLNQKLSRNIDYERACFEFQGGNIFSPLFTRPV